MSRRTKEIRIRVNPTEEKNIKQNAERLNMQVAPYIRMVAQNPTIIQNDYSAIREHTKQLGQIVNSVNRLIFTIELNNEYQPKQIEGIRDYVAWIWDTEKKLLDTVRKQWNKQYKQNRK